MSKRFSKVMPFCLVLTLLIISLAILFTACNDISDDKVFSSDGIEFTLNSGNYEVTGYNGNAKYVVIPSTYQSRKVTEIADGAFYKCSEIVEIKIEDSIYEIGKSAFSGCTSLQSVSLPDYLSEIGDYAFSGCTRLQSVKINRGTIIGNYAFNNCASLSSATIGASIIRSHAFANCTKLTDITLSDNVRFINGYAFDNTAWYNNQPDGLVYAGKIAYMYKGIMSKNASIAIKEGTIAIADFAFSNCYSCLAKITFPNSLERIGDHAFDNCSGLTDVKFPEKVSDIGDYAFNYCDGLKNIVIPESLKFIGIGTFRKCTGLTEVKWKAIDCMREHDEWFPIFDGCTNLSMIYLYKKTKHIPGLLNLLESEDSIFMNEKCADITFDGTKSEWDKADYYVRRNCKIICLDGNY